MVRINNRYAGGQLISAKRMISYPTARDWLTLAPTLEYIEHVPLVASNTNIVIHLRRIAFNLEIARRKCLGGHHGGFTLPSALGCPESWDGELAPLLLFRRALPQPFVLTDLSVADDLWSLLLRSSHLFCSMQFLWEISEQVDILWAVARMYS